jgi:Zn-dependent protease with chaperone function/tetratricopeptide (TPR) repeat protein
MTAILLILLVAQPAPDESSHVANKLTTQLVEAIRIMNDDPEEAVRRLNALLDDPKARELEGSSPSVRAIREQALYFRGQVQLRQGKAQAAADDMTDLLDRKRAQFLSQIAGLVAAQASPLPHAALDAALRFSPPAPMHRMGDYPALWLRADAYKQLGQHEKERADRAEAMAILSEMRRGLPASSYHPPNPPPIWLTWPGTLVRWMSSPRFVSAVFGVMVPVLFLMGLRQRREAGGSWRRLFWVSLALAALQTVPLLAAFLLLRWRPELSDEADLPFVTAVLFGINVVRHRSYLVAVRWVHSREAPPLLEDPAVLGRIAQIAGRLGIAPPLTRLARSPTSLQQNNALVTGLVAHTMVLYDGILYRLAEDERDAIIAHELAHLANHTFWYRLVSAAVCGVAVVTASAFYPVVVVFGFGVALWTGSWLILSRWFELDCDRRAARAIGHRRTSSALWKIHTDQPFHGLTEFLIGAVATHPSRDDRLAAIRRDAPKDDMPEVEWDPRLLRYRRLAAWCAAGLWLSVIVACLLWGYRSPRSNWPALPLVLMEAALFVLVWFGLRKTIRRQRRLQRTGRAWRRRLIWLSGALVVGFWVAGSFGLTERYLSHVTTIAASLVSCVAFLVLIGPLGRGRSNKLNLRIVIAIQSGDYPRALALAEGSPKVVARSIELRYNHALIRAVLGRREEALSDLEQLRRDEPGFKMTWLLLASLYADEGEYLRALELATQLSHDLPGEPDGPQAESWLLRKLGRLEEAEIRARDVLKMEPRSGLAHLTLAAVAFDRGDHAAAREELAQAERLVPGSMTAALFAAEMALATGDGTEAAVSQAVQTAKNNPLSFADKEVAALVQRLEERRQASRIDKPDEAGIR